MSSSNQCWANRGLCSVFQCAISHYRQVPSLSAPEPLILGSAHVGKELVELILNVLCSGDTADDGFDFLLRGELGNDVVVDVALFAQNAGCVFKGDRRLLWL